MRAERKGIALLAALIVMVVAGTFLVAAYYAARSDERTARLALRVAQLDGANDRAVASLLATWDSAARFAQDVGVPQDLPLTSADQGVATAMRVTRLSRLLYLVAVRSRDIRDTSVAASGTTLLRVVTPDFPSLGVLTARGDVGPPAGFGYMQADPAALATCGASYSGAADLPGFAVPPDRTAPSPSVGLDAAGADSTYRLFGEMALNDLAARASRELPAGVSASAPTGGISLAQGDLTLTGGEGSGVLIVQGRLMLDGPVVFRGVVIVLGGLEARSTGSLFEGLVLVDAASSPAVVANDHALVTVRFDPCVVSATTWHAGRVTRVNGWNWHPTQ